MKAFTSGQNWNMKVIWAYKQWSNGIWKERRLSFLDVMVARKPNGTLSHKVYWKPTPTDRYLNSRSNHHRSQKRGVIKTVSKRARRICEPSELEKDLKHLERVLDGADTVNNNSTERLAQKTYKHKAVNFPADKSRKK